MESISLWDVCWHQYARESKTDVLGGVWNGPGMEIEGVGRKLR